MHLVIESQRPWDIAADVLAIAVPTSGELPEAVLELDRRLGGVLLDMRRMGALPRKAWRSRLVPASGIGSRYVLIVGTGDGVGRREGVALDRLGLRRLGAVMVRALAGCDVTRLVIDVPESLVAGLSDGIAAEMLVRGLIDGGEAPSSVYDGEDDQVPPRLERATLCLRDPDASVAVRAERGRIIGEGVARTRRLAHRAANDVSPQVLADEASDLARRHDLELTVLGPEDAAQAGMGMFTAVGRGSSNPSRFIALRSKPGLERDTRGRLLAMVGKGVTFDSGGLSLKPPASMVTMKSDKTGACTVINAIATVAQLAPDVPLLAVAPAVENMPGPHSTRPGDVVRALNGRTVEINNTDAEGRLILGDALTWAERQGATHLVDVATLTGAMARALGRYTTGGFGSDEGLWAEVAAAAERQGEPLWRMPLVEDLRKDLDSPFADMLNTGQAEGGAITAALFLREFVTRPWVHLDVAGTAYLTQSDPFSSKGATGVMHATLVELALAGAEGAAAGD
jgi:leucyl aminopeptidase